jgi:hypothetical protein
MGCRDAVDAIVVTVSFEVAEPFAGAMEVGTSPHVGAKVGVGDTEQLSDTVLLNPFSAVAVTAKSTELPTVAVATVGVALMPKS